MRSWIVAMVVLGGCTEPNPNAGDGTDTEDATSAATVTASTTTAPTTNSAATSMSTSTTGPTTSATQTETAVTGDTETTGDTIECPVTHQCAAAAEDGWTGPVVVAVANKGSEPECADEYPTQELAAFTDLIAPAPDCSCECNAPVGESCSRPTLEYHQNDENCVGAATEEVLVSTSCSVVDNAAVNDYWQIEPPPVTGGSCSSVDDSEIVDPTWGSGVRACSGAMSLGRCGPDAECMPNPAGGYEAGLCVFQTGDHECPAAYPERVLYHSTIADTRACSSCSCGSPEGDCTGRVVAFQQDNCTMPTNTFTVDDGSCDQANGFLITGAQWNPDPPEAECTPQGGEASGEATPATPVTFCCLQ